METYDDQQLINLLRNPATLRKGFESMVRQYSEQLYWQVRRIVITHEDADDVVQNALLKAWNSIGTFKGDSKVFTWLSRIAIGDETEAQLQEAIASLPDVQRTVFQLRYYDEMKYSEISRILGTSEGGLKASYHIAVKKITDFFHRHD